MRRTDLLDSDQKKEGGSLEVVDVIRGEETKGGGSRIEDLESRIDRGSGIGDRESRVNGEDGTQTFAGTNL